MMSIGDILVGLSARRPLFHSEADFQHALAWELHSQSPDSALRLEYPIEGQTGRIYVDIWASSASLELAIELKYKTRRLVVTQEQKSFALKDQSAQDQGRYDFLKDVQRLEQITATHRSLRGCAVLLTNDSAYWRTPRNSDTVDAAFRTHEGRIATGRLSWGARASSGTKRTREDPIVLNGTYRLSWRDYSEPSRGSYGKFRYLAVEVRG